MLKNAPTRYSGRSVFFGYELYVLKPESNIPIGFYKEFNMDFSEKNLVVVVEIAVGLLICKLMMHAIGLNLADLFNTIFNLWPVP